MKAKAKKPMMAKPMMKKVVAPKTAGMKKGKC
jgi:hypothetical protein